MNPVVFLRHRDPLRETSQSLWHAKIFPKKLLKGHIRVHWGSTSGQCDASISARVMATMHNRSCQSEGVRERGSVPLIVMVSESEVRVPVAVVVKDNEARVPVTEVVRVRVNQTGHKIQVDS